jgi:hypothetical protein
MYITPVKTILTEALKQTFDASYPEPDFRNVHIDIEYPVDEQDYPSIWIDYEDTQDLTRAGVAHIETVDPVLHTSRPAFTRMRFQGYISMTVVAMTSLERDRLFDEVVRVVAFGNEDATLGRFRSYINNNDLIAFNIDTDRIQPRGSAAAPGTPWSTDELMYERTLNVGMIGEFIPDLATGTLVNISKIVMIPTVDTTGDLGDPPLYSTEIGIWH